jgi:hypothetical protein
MRVLAAAIRAVLQEYYCESIRIHTQSVRCLVSFDLILHHDCISKKLSMGLDIGSVFFYMFGRRGCSFNGRNMHTRLACVKRLHARLPSQLAARNNAIGHRQVLVFFPLLNSATFPKFAPRKP